MNWSDFRQNKEFYFRCYRFQFLVETFKSSTFFRWKVVISSLISVIPNRSLYTVPFLKFKKFLWLCEDEKVRMNSFHLWGQSFELHLKRYTATKEDVQRVSSFFIPFKFSHAKSSDENWTFKAWRNWFCSMTSLVNFENTCVHQKNLKNSIVFITLF